MVRFIFAIACLGLGQDAFSWTGKWGPQQYSEVGVIAIMIIGIIIISVVHGEE